MKNSKFVQIKVLISCFFKKHKPLYKFFFLVKDTVSSASFMSALDACTCFTHPTIMEKMGFYCPKPDNKTLFQPE